MVEVKHRKMLRAKLIFILFVNTFVPLFILFFVKLPSIYLLSFTLLVFLLSVLLLFLVLKPLSKLITGVATLSQGNLNYRVDIRTQDELEEVADSFNSMAGKLQEAFNKLEQDNIIISMERNKLSSIISSIIDGTIAIDFSKNIVLLNKSAEEITGYSLKELKDKPIDQFIHLFTEEEEITPKTYCQPQFNRTLKLVGREGKQVKVNLVTTPVVEGVQTNLGCILTLHDLTRESELEQMKLDFVSMASHELKTPLTSITGYLSVFIDENKNKINKEELELVEKSLVASKQLYNLVENILNVNKIERGQITVNIESIDLGSVLQREVENLQNQAKLKNISLNLIRSQTPLPKVLADSIRIGEVINNLVANAINYTNPGGKIEIYTQVLPNQVITTIEDNGLGIPKEAIPHLFNKFFRVSNAVQKASKGTGLGLYISKSIVEKLNGKIWVESEPGKGSKFHFSLPSAENISSGLLNTQQFVSQSIQSGILNY